MLALKHWSLPILILYLTALTTGSLGNVSNVPKLGSSFDDKIYHFLAYAMLTLLLFNFFLSIKFKHTLILSLAIAIVYGIIIEALQAVLTDFRTPDYFDVIANTFGALVMCLILRFTSKLKLN